MKHISEKLLTVKDISGLKDLGLGHIDEVINMVRLKPIREDHQELKDKIISKLTQIKEINKRYKLANAEVHRRKKAVKLNQMASSEHEEAKMERQQILDEKDKIIKLIYLDERRYEIFVKLAAVKAKVAKVQAELDKAKNNCDEYKKQFPYLNR